MENKQSLFYNFPNDKFWKIVDDAKKLAFEIKVDMLKNSFTRQPADKTIDEVIKLLKADKKCHQVFIHRRHYKEYLEIGANTISLQENNVDYFLWVHVKIEHLNFFKTKYGIELMEVYKQFI